MNISLFIRAIQTKRKANIAKLNDDVIGYAKLLREFESLVEHFSPSERRSIEREATLSKYEQWLYKKEVYTKGV